MDSAGKVSSPAKELSKVEESSQTAGTEVEGGAIVNAPGHPGALEVVAATTRSSGTHVTVEGGAHEGASSYPRAEDTVAAVFECPSVQERKMPSRKQKWTPSLSTPGPRGEMATVSLTIKEDASAEGEELPPYSEEPPTRKAARTEEPTAELPQGRRRETQTPMATKLDIAEVWKEAVDKQLRQSRRIRTVRH